MRTLFIVEDEDYQLKVVPASAAEYGQFGKKAELTEEEFWKYSVLLEHHREYQRLVSDLYEKGEEV